MISNPFSLENKTVLVTGASSGIGRACAVEFSNMGAKCCILVARNKEALEQTAALMNPECEVIVKTCDLSVTEDLEKLVVELPSLDGLMLNAGVNKMKPIQFYSQNDLENIFSVNCFSSMLLVKQLMKKKKLNSGCSIIFTASISGFNNVSVGNGIYGASKSALSAFMKYAALELAPKGVRCNAIHPGRIETPLIHNGVTGEEEIRKDIEKYPLRRYGKPEEVAWMATYLLSDAATWITGTDLVIDGGRSLI